MKKTIGFLAAAATLVAMVAGCSMFGGIGAPDVTIGGVLIDYTTGTPITYSSEADATTAIEGVVFKVAGKTREAVKPVIDELSDGTFEAGFKFKVGSYENVIVEATVTGYESFVGSVTANATGFGGDVVNHGYEQLANIGLIPTSWAAATNPNAFTITITDEDTYAVVSGATVTIEAVEGQALNTIMSTETYGTMISSSSFGGVTVNGTGEVTHEAVSGTTDSTGKVSVLANTLYDNIKYVISVTKDGYQTYLNTSLYTSTDTSEDIVGDYELNGTDQTANIEISLDPIADATNLYPFKIKVLENDTDAPLAGATVTVMSYDYSSVTTTKTDLTTATSVTDSDGLIAVPAGALKLSSGGTSYDGSGLVYVVVSKDDYIQCSQTETWNAATYINRDFKDWTWTTEAGQEYYSNGTLAYSYSDVPPDGILRTYKLEPSGAATVATPKMVSTTLVNSENVGNTNYLDALPLGKSVTLTFDTALTLAPGVNYQNLVGSGLYAQDPDAGWGTPADWTWATRTTGTNAGTLTDWDQYNTADISTYFNDACYEVSLSSDGKTLTITVVGTAAATRTNEIFFKFDLSKIGVKWAGQDKYVPLFDDINSTANVTGVTRWAQWYYDSTVYDTAVQ